MKGEHEKRLQSYLDEFKQEITPAIKKFVRGVTNIPQFERSVRRFGEHLVQEAFNRAIKEKREQEIIEQSKQ